MRLQHVATAMTHCLLPSFLSILLTLALLSPSPLLAQVTLLIPARPDINQKTKETPKKEAQKKQTKEELTTKEKSKSDEAGDATLPRITEETDILITRMTPFANDFFAMDMPQAFTVFLYNKNLPLKDGRKQAKRYDLLGDIEEILYKNKKAWGANVELVHPGLYQFVLETRPWWDEGQKYFVQHFVKVMLPVYGDDTGWEEPTGHGFEIVPQTRPFGLLAPALFSGKVLVDGQPQPNCLLIVERINTDGQKVPTPWHQSMVLRCDANGQFAAIVNRGGWWCCRALIEGAPLKGTDGQPKALQLEALYWFFVDSDAGTSR